MEIAVLGGGNGSFAAAADLSERGHRVRLWRRASGKSNVPETIALTDSRGQSEVPIAEPTTDLDLALHGAALVIVPLPAPAHIELFATIASKLRDDQVVLLTPGSFGAVALAKRLLKSGSKARVVNGETATLPWLCRKSGTSAVAIRARTTRLPVGFFPADRSPFGLNVVCAAFPAAEQRTDVLDCALLNPGPVIHPPLVLMNAGPLEHFDRWDIHNEGTQPSIRRVIGALDEERIQIRVALGYRSPHFPLQDYYSPGVDEWMYGRQPPGHFVEKGDWREKIDLARHRYLLEDVEHGLALLVSCAQYAGVSAPIAEGLLTLASAAIGREMRQTGRLFQKLGIAPTKPAQLAQLLREGFLA